MELFRYLDFIKKNESNDFSSSTIPTYEDCVEMCNREDSPFYESKLIIENYSISLFNYRFASPSDFQTPKSREMRGICFIFNTDGSLFKRYILLEKFFNLNQVPGSMYSDVKDLVIKSITNKEDGSISSFLLMPDGKIIGKSKMGFDNDQAKGINRIYRTNKNIKKFVDWSISKDYVAIFEFVSPTNRIVLKYNNEELILLRIRDNKTGKHLNIKDYINEIGSIRIAPFEDENSLDELIEKSKNETGREGWVITFENGQMVKIKTSEYMALHGLLTNDLYREHILIGYILEDKIDDILGQIPEEEVEAHDRINKIILIVKKSLNEKVIEIQKAYEFFINTYNGNKKEYALKYLKIDPNFGYVMALAKGEYLKNLTDSEISEIYTDYSNYEASVNKCEINELVKSWVREKTKRLNIARDWLKSKDSTLFFTEPDEENDDI